MLSHRSLRVGGGEARLDPSGNLNAEGSKRIAHGRSRRRAPVGRQGLTLPGQQAVHHVTVGTLPARARLLEERADCARRLRGGLRLGLGLGLGRAGLATSLPAALAALSGQGALPSLGSQRLLAQLLVVGEGTGVALRTVFPWSRKWKQILLAAPFPPPLAPETGRQGAVLGRRARRPGRGCIGSRLELPDLLLRLSQGRRRVRHLAWRGRVRRVRHRSVSRFSLLVL